MLPTRRLLGLEFADAGLAQVAAWCEARPAGAPFAAIVTPNADHLVRLHRDPGLIPLYRDAALRVLDSRVVARLARWRGLVPPAVVPGSDLTAALLRGIAARGEAVTILGMADAARQRLAARLGLAAIAHHEPPMGFDRDPGAFADAVAFIEAHPARFTFLAVGAPRQERVAQALAARGRARGLGLCIGASLLFLSGDERRAPVAVQRAGLEWAWRLAQDPRRLARRYLVDSPAILRLLAAEARRG